MKIPTLATQLKPHQFDKEIAEANKAFMRLPRWQQRVLIVQDVLKQIRARKYQITPGFWVRTGVAGDPIEQKHLTVLLPDLKCKVCEVGALMLSSVRLADACKVEKHPDPTSVFQQVQKFFDRAQMVLIEIAFERANGWFAKNETGDDAKTAALKKAAAEFGKGLSAQARALKICRNIIRNKGTFKP